MGVYATIEGVPDDCDSQLKCWGNDLGLPTYRLGSRVPSIDYSIVTYSVQYNLGDGYLHVTDNIITNVSALEALPDRPVFSKWGDRL